MITMAFTHSDTEISMDIHPPGSRIHSLKDYLIHLSMVVLGILIALSLEGLREVWHEHSLVEHSVEAMRTEMESNKALLNKVIANYDSSRTTVQHMIEMIEARQRAKSSHSSLPDDDTTETLNLAIPPLSSGAWQAAVATQAFAHMDYGQAQQWSSVYAFQNQIQLLQNDWIAVYGRLSLLSHLSGEDSAEQLQRQLLLAQEVEQRIDMTQFAWHGLLVRYDATLAASAPK